MKILVTGATGFIGNYVVEDLIRSKNLEIITTSYDSIEKAKDLSWFESVKHIHQNLNDENENYFKLFNEPDVLIHLSWEGLPNFKERYHFERNTLNNYNFIKNMISNGLKDINVIGTWFEYCMQSGALS